jgi:SlyX protein
MSNERIDRLEERLAWLERHVTAQDKEMLALHDELARQQRVLSMLRVRLTEDTSGDGGDTSESLNDRPPHY